MDQDVRKLSDDDLISILDKRVEFETLNESEMIDFIREVMSRRLYLKYGAESIFEFLTRAHYHYAPAVAQRKLDAARMMQLFPEVKQLLSSQEINLTQLGMLATAVRQKPTPPKLQRAILESMRGQTVQNTQIIISEVLEIEFKQRSKIRVQRDGSVRVEMTFSKQDWEAIERAKELISHSVPSGDLGEVLSYCVRTTIKKKDLSTSATEVKARQCATKEVKPCHYSTSIKEIKLRPRQSVSRSSRRFIFQRDKSCRHRHANGRICESRYQLQVDHIISRWAGGTNDVENRCVEFTIDISMSGRLMGNHPKRPAVFPINSIQK